MVKLYGEMDRKLYAFCVLAVNGLYFFIMSMWRIVYSASLYVKNDTFSELTV